LLAFSGTIISGEIHLQNNTVNTNHANKKFTATPANNIAVFAQKEAIIKLSFALKVHESEGSSHLSLTKPPNGIAFRVYSVPLLSVHRVKIFGGIPIPNSNTCTPVFFATIKCPNSCINTKNKNNTIPKTIHNIRQSIINKTIIITCNHSINKYNRN
jgi:hypothetical protein